ncbi:hypothetical protein EDEG_00761 [Edhazardia aedis USNM 41457]|uniref:Sel1 repeat protein n=1 Tax=Edhazardia aedis (strain USNM 41457) TaxID=1003232 RepID=J9DRF9_EDHAE|nr:hypothetical protein EDEG_00761 [Edhazardia aedis USNM 41457]|eukprot:EJW05150.1 hypothetical protein EDEG_00761 [Edhazardia aedis USNM 41457]
MQTKTTSEILKDYKKEFSVAFLDVKSTLKDKVCFICKYLRDVELMDTKKYNTYFLSNPLETLLYDKDNIEMMEKHCLECLKGLCKKEAATGTSVVDDQSATVLAGQVYELGAFGQKRDLNKAAAFYVSSANSNCVKGTYKLGTCFERNSDKTPQNMEKAISFYRLAAKLGNIEAMHMYGSLLVGGLNSNLGKRCDGMLYLKMAAKLANAKYPYPYFDLGTACEEGNDLELIGCEEDYVFNIYYAGAKFGDANCQNRIAKCFDTGELGCSIQIGEAIKWSFLAAENGNTEALSRSAYYLYTGIPGIVERDTTRALKYAQLAASRGHMDAAYLSGLLFEENTQNVNSIIDSLFWFKIAGQFGHERAAEKSILVEKYLNAKSVE